MSEQSLSFQYKLALFFSAIGSPFVVITLFSIWITLAYSGTWLEFLEWGGTSFLFVVLLPFLYVYYGVRKGFLTNIHIMVREQRSEPFKIAIATTTLLIVSFWLEKAPHQLMALAVTLWVSGILFYLITQFWKVSVHAAALTGSIVIASMLVTPKALIFFIFLPIVIWSRLHRGRHNVAQSIVAAIVVSFTVYLVLKLFHVA